MHMAKEEKPVWKGYMLYNFSYLVIL
jgi:hypothetical protein